MKFQKYVVGGNDFIIFDYGDTEGKDLKNLASQVCDRQYGLGADGILVYKNSQLGVEMLAYDKLGNEGGPSATGLIGFTKYLFDRSLVGQGENPIITKYGRVHTDLLSGQEGSVSLDLGQPIFKASEIPVAMDLDRVVGQSIDVAGYDYIFSSIRIGDGDVETVIFVQKINDAQVAYLGEKISNHEIFPKGSNVNFIKKLAGDQVDIHTWHKDKGRILTSWAGACAGVVVGNVMESLEPRVRVNSDGGNLVVDYLSDQITITARAEFVAEGRYNFK